MVQSFYKYGYLSSAHAVLQYKHLQRYCLLCSSLKRSKMNIPKPFTKKDNKRSQTSLKGSSSSIPNGSATKRYCVNMEELMQFEAARQRALAQMIPDDYARPFSEFVPHRVFINNVDTFNGSHLVEYLSNAKRVLNKEERGEGEYEESKPEKTSDEVLVNNYYERTGEEEEVGEEGEQEEVEEEESFDSVLYKNGFSDTYEIIGSLEFYNNPEYSRSEAVSELLDNEKKIDFLEKLLTCGFIIYDITSDLQCHPKQVEEAKWVLENIVKRLEMMETKHPKAFSKYTHCRIFVLISTLLTWAKTKPVNPEDPSLPLTERDFRKRKPHPNYKVHWELEKKVIELGKKFPNHLKTIVIGSGVTYGYEEDVLHFLFKMAWQDAPFLPVFKPGTNIIPVIHIDSLASIVHSVLENFPQKFKYIVAADPHSATLKEIAKLLATNLGNGKTKMVHMEEAFLYPDIKQRNYDLLSTNVNVVPGYIMDNMITRWGTDLPMTQNISQLISQFKKARGLLAVKIFIHGPPASGKSLLAKYLSAYYDIPHLDEKGVIEEMINSLKEKIKAKTDTSEDKEGQQKIDLEDAAEEEEEEEEENDAEQEDLGSLKQTLREIEENMEKNGNNKLDDEYVIRFFKQKLSSNSCKNKGYVIDGYPETMEQTKILYAPVSQEEELPGEDEEAQGGDISRLCNVDIMPAYVESLDASDEFLINRVIKVPEINLTQFEEHEMCRRLTEFRALNTEDNTPLIFYDEMEVHPMIYNIENDFDNQMKPTLQAIIDHIGPPRNYHGKEKSSLEDIFDTHKNYKYDCDKKQLEDMKTQRDEMKKYAEERRQNLEKWMFLKNQELEMEEKALLVMGMPLRHYLMKYVFPCLTRGLVEVARLRPEDPVDFLSEFLFRENPEGKMFQPNYEENEEKLSQAMKEYENMLAERQIAQSRSSRRTFSTEKSIRSDVVSRVTGYKCSFVSTATSTATSGATAASSASKSKSKKTSRASLKSSSSLGICTCQKSPSLSTCSSDRTPSSPVSCTCDVPEPCESSDTSDEAKKEDPCKCPCKV